MKYTLKVSNTNRKEYSDLVSALVHGYGLCDFSILNHKGFYLSFHCDEQYLAKYIYHYVPENFDFDKSIDVSFVLNSCYDRYFLEQCTNVLTQKELERLKKKLRETID